MGLASVSLTLPQRTNKQTNRHIHFWYREHALRSSDQSSDITPLFGSALASVPSRPLNTSPLAADCFLCFIFHFCRIFRKMISHHCSGGRCCLCPLPPDHETRHPLSIGALDWPSADCFVRLLLFVSLLMSLIRSIIC